MALGYLTVEVVRLYPGPVLTAGPTTDPEQYTFSVVWLGFGVVLLLAGCSSIPSRHGWRRAR